MTSVMQVGKVMATNTQTASLEESTLSLCIKIFMWMAFLLISGPLDGVQAEPIVIRGNSHGLWSPSHPHATGLPANPPGADIAVSNVFAAPPFNPPEPEAAEIVPTFDVCPTLLSAPHLCQNI